MSVLSGCVGEVLGERGWVSWGGFWGGGMGAFYVGAEFSLSAGFCAVGFLLGLLKIWTF